MSLGVAPARRQARRTPRPPCPRPLRRRRWGKFSGPAAQGSSSRPGGRVVRVLADDREGARHERFLVRIDGVSVLVAHNLDLAPRVPLQVGDSVQLRGEYEWNAKDGITHWTHPAPDGRPDAGWIRHEGRLYQ